MKVINSLIPLKFWLLCLCLNLVSFVSAQLKFQQHNTRQAIYSGIVCAMVDINGDYNDDLLTLDQSKSLWLGVNNGSGYFFWKKLDYSASDPLWSIAVADIDRNGRNDILIGGDYYGIQVFYQTENGFRRDTITDSQFYSQSSTVYDINKDGWLDFTICDDNAKTRVFENKKGELFNNYSWINLSQANKTDEEGNYGCLWSDLDQDGDGDLYISKCSPKASERTDPRRINLYYKQDSNAFRESARELGIACDEQSWITVSGDVNDDGRFDLIVANHYGPSIVYTQDSIGQFIDHTLESGIALTTFPFQMALEDWDNDGDLDLLSVGSGVEYFSNDGKGVFTKENLQMEFPDFTSLSWGDINADGCLDIYSSYAGLVNNPSIVADKLWYGTPNNNHWVSFGLAGKSSNPNGIGAIIHIHTGEKVQIRELQSGTSYGLQKSLNVHFGLGNYKRIDSMFIFWPSGIVDRFFDIPVDQFYLTGEGSCITPRTKIFPRGVINLCSGEDIELTSYVQYDKLLWSHGAKEDTIKVNQTGSYFYKAVNRFNCPIVSENTTLIIDPVENPRLNISGEKILCPGEKITLEVTGYKNLIWSNNSTDTVLIVDNPGIFYAKYLGLCKDFTTDSIRLRYNSEAIVPQIKADTLYGPDTARLHSDLDNTLWYNEQMDKIPLFEGKDFESQKINSARSFWARTYTKEAYTPLKGGMKSPVYTGGAYPASFLNPEMFFEAYSDFTLDSVTVFTDTEGERELALKFKGDTQFIQTIRHTLNKGMNRLYLGFRCFAGKNYSILTNPKVNQNNFGYVSPRLERSNTAFTYPFVFGDVCKISNSSVGDIYYYNFFDWSIKPIENICYSDWVEVPVVMITTDIKDDSSNSFHIMLNAEKNKLSVNRSDKDVAQLTLYNIQGQLIQSTRHSNLLSTQQLTTGYYILYCLMQDGKSYSLKFWKE